MNSHGKLMPEHHHSNDGVSDVEWDDGVENHPPMADSSDAEMVDQAMGFMHNAQPLASGTSFAPLQKPVAVPQVSPALGAPFARAYAEVLQSYDINPVVWTEFVDNFNVLLTGSPPLTALSVAGQALSFVPVHYLGLAGTGLQMAAGLGKYAMVKTRCAHFVKRSNEQFFVPRGLKVKILKTEHLARICGVSLEEFMVKPLQPGTNLDNVGGPLDRRLEAVSGRVADLTLNVPPPTEQTNILAKISAKESAHSEAKMNKKTMKNREKAMEKMPTTPGGVNAKAQKDLDKLDKEEEKVYRKETEPRKIEKELRKIEEDRRKVMEDAQKDAAKDQEDSIKEDKEVKKSKKGLWIIVFNRDAVEHWEAEEEKRKANGPFGFLRRSKK
ncbi:hypothetical protein LTR10_015258 [Elasticomyces elasticus]|uniref:Uncharacterized protein n=1 Tax=Exophiala sideris TaxID=1016849 RepID=A0ABR0JEX7_9EURO|nr:hypothetical protein LTR10_015258 [Elasticomyces elasticus]KAK5032733.1 hypothetical protein LTS07_004143 [Exophiala sideris]KAK5037087.1 hypothetical protein LTR13_004892 [Exophiala sideris]KAK5062257.1 hypothetical protein LTR69_004615 [Exophiala sideris]KAK5182245.1 hypothetical protein LTR44_005256 [Eurotiomycetes sp. CCFEE 6388]